jgi:hypothetical protein
VIQCFSFGHWSEDDARPEICHSNNPTTKLDYPIAKAKSVSEAVSSNTAREAEADNA